MFNKLDIIVDLQFGSTGKGLLAGFLAKRQSPDTLITAWAPNAGHTFIDSFGTKFVHCMVPNGVVSSGLQRIMFGPGSVIDVAGMMEELDGLVAAGFITPSVQIAIHENAAVRLTEHMQLEKQYRYRIGSTMKGVGEAVMQKIRRNGDQTSNLARNLLPGTLLGRYLVNQMEWHNLLSQARNVQIEGHQGYSLSINHGFYPYTTSRDCTTLQILADCGVPYSDVPKSRGYYGTTIWGSARTFPIRVANRFDENGNQIGTSGPCYFDQTELEWRKDLGLEPELTTVTKLPRRIFSWSEYQIRSAIRENGVDKVFLNFCNYEREPQDIQRKIIQCEEAGASVELLGFGPSEDEVISTWAYDFSSTNPFAEKRNVA